MKLSAHYKKEGCDVELYDPSHAYDRVHVSKIFSFTPDYSEPMVAAEVLKGGSGYGDYSVNLPDDVEHLCPDYSLYPRFEHAYGFTTRGCVNKCSFCIVPKKEGGVIPHAEISEFISDRKSVVLMDNNILSHAHGLRQLEKSIDLRLKIDINQGLDARIISKSPDIAQLLARCKYIKGLYLAYDNSGITDEVVRAIELLGAKGIKPYRLTFYVLCKTGKEGISDAYNRVMLLRSLGVNPFVMPYRDLTSLKDPEKDQKELARWVNHKAVFKSCTFDEYLKSTRK